jgi:hypothetical protein
MTHSAGVHYSDAGVAKQFKRLDFMGVQRAV